MTTAIAHRYVVQVVLTEEQAEDRMIKGTVDFMAHAEFIQIYGDIDESSLFNIHPPAHIAVEDTKAWAEKVAEGMVTNHYHAYVVAAEAPRNPE